MPCGRRAQAAISSSARSATLKESKFNSTDWTTTCHTKHPASKRIIESVSNLKHREHANTIDGWFSYYKCKSLTCSESMLHSRHLRSRPPRHPRHSMQPPKSPSAGTTAHSPSPPRTFAGCSTPSTPPPPTSGSSSRASLA